MNIENIVKTFQKSENSGSFFTTFDIPSKDFSFQIKEIGEVSGLITATKAKQLISKSKLAAFGWKDQTIVDTTIRNTWEISKDKIKISKTTFKSVFNDALEKIKLDLGLAENSSIEAELHNLIVYEKNQFFSSHQDSEKSDDMVATMVVLLPSTYTGGSFIVDLQGDKHTYKAQKPSKNKLQILAFYADCHHEVKKVLSGYRVALTYNLILKQNKKESKPILKQNNKLASAIEQYFATPITLKSYKTEPHWLIYLLDHQYSASGLSWEKLKGQDRDRVAQLIDVAKKNDLNLHLALAELHEILEAEGDYYDEDNWYGNRYNKSKYKSNAEPEAGDLIDDDYQISNLIPLNQKQAKKYSCSIAKEMICWTRSFHEDDPFDSQYEGYMGNWGNTIERWYHRAAIILWPKKNDFASYWHIDQSMALDTQTKLLKSLKNENEKQMMVTSILNSWKQLRVNDKEDLAQTLVEFILLAKVEAVATTMLSGFTLNVIFSIKSKLNVLIKEFGEVWFLQMLKKWQQNAKKSYAREYIESFSDVLKYLKEYRKASLWIISYQFVQWQKETKETNAKFTPGSNARQIKELVRTAKDLLIGTNNLSDKNLMDSVVTIILESEQVFTCSIIGDIALDLKNLGIRYPDKLIKSAKKRLSDEIKIVRDKNDVSILQIIPCKCNDCKILEKFLTDKKEIQLIWPLAKERRRHIHGIVDSMDINVTHDTKREGSPQKIVLTKQKIYFDRLEKMRNNNLKILEQLQKITA